MPNSYSRCNRSNNSTLALLSKPPLAPAPQVEGRLVTPGGVGQHSPAHGGHHSIAKPGGRPFALAAPGCPLRDDPQGATKAVLAEPTPQLGAVARSRCPLLLEPGQVHLERALPGAEQVRSLTAQHLADETTAVPGAAHDLLDRH